MFTGIITDIGTLEAISKKGEHTLTLATAYAPESLWIGQSIACDGVCLTVIEKGAHPQGAWFRVQASPETLAVTTLGDWVEGKKINLEKALVLGQDLSGHLVSGHVDGVARITGKTPQGESVQYMLTAPAALARYIAVKGSVTLDGTSLTVNQVERAAFSVTIIPHTLQATTLGLRSSGDRVNLEVDMIARYVEKLMK